MSALPPETASPIINVLVTGHFVETQGYHIWRPHGTDDYLLMLTLAGSGRIGWDGGEEQTQPGDLILLSPRTRHDYGIAPGTPVWEMVWTHFLPYAHWLPLLDWPTLTPGVGLLRLEAEQNTTMSAQEAALRAMHARAISGRARREAWAMNALEEALLECDEGNPKRKDRITDSRVAHAVAHLRQHFTEPFYLPDLARKVRLSSSRLSHLFREHTGQTPRQYLERERINRAAQLLRFTSRSVQAIAADVGFESPFYFSLRFKAETGLAPRDFRRFGGQEKA